MKLTIEVPKRVHSLLHNFAKENDSSVDKIVQKVIEELIVDIQSVKRAMAALEDVKKELGLSDDLLEQEL